MPMVERKPHFNYKMHFMCLVMVPLIKSNLLANEMSLIPHKQMDIIKMSDHSSISSILFVNWNIRFIQDNGKYIDKEGKHMKNAKNAHAIRQLYYYSYLGYDLFVR